MLDTGAFTAISSAYGALLPAGILALLCYAAWRTRSRHILAYRAWRLASGIQEIGDPEIKAFVDEQTSLMSFRFLAGVPVRSAELARQLIQWTRQQGIEMEDVRRCGAYFDADARRVRVEALPSRGKRTAMAWALLPLIAMLFISLALIFTDGALVQLKSTGRWLQLSPTGAARITARGAAVTKTTCAAGMLAAARQDDFTQAEVEALCGILGDAEAVRHVEASVRSQRYVFAALSVLMGFFLFRTWRLLEQAMHAGSLARRQLDSSLAPATA